MIKKILIFLLLVSFCYAASFRSAANLNLTVTDQGAIKAVGGELKYVAINITEAQQRDYQQATYSSPSDFKIVFDENGNNLMSMVDSNPSNPFRYSAVTKVTTIERVTNAIPSSYQMPNEFLRYAKSTPRIQSDYSKIKELARSITANSTSDFEKVAKLAIWVKENVDYDLSTSGKWYDAKWILENKKGVCIEYTTLFAAMARSSGIPTRIILGIVYDDEKNDWIGHAWNEVYLGKWVPVDATWLEVGYLDATHIEMGRYVDNETPVNAYAVTTGNANLTWDTTSAGADPTKKGNVVLEGIAYKEEEDVYGLRQGARELNFGDSSVVYVTIYPEDYRVATLNLLPCKGSYDVIDVEDEEKRVILEPGKTKVVSWIVHSNPNLQKNYIYTCPVSLNSDYLKESEISFKISEDVRKVDFDAWLSSSRINLGEEEAVYVDVKSNFAGEIGYISDNNESTKRVNGAGRYSFGFKPEKIGLNELNVFTDAGGAKKLSFWVAEEVNLSIVSFNVPEFIAKGVGTSINATVRNNGPVAKNVKLILTAGEDKQIEQVSLSDEKQLSFNVVLNQAGEDKITLSMETPEFSDEITRPVRVYSPPTINLSSVNFYLENEKAMAELYFSVEGEAKDANLTVDEKPLSFSSKVVAQLDPGMHFIKIKYSDVANRSYTKSGFIEVPSISDIKKNSPFSFLGVANLGGTFGILIIIVAVLLLFLIVLFVVLKRKKKTSNDSNS